MHLLATLLVALLAAICFAGSAVLQQTSAKGAPEEASLRLRLLWHLAQRRAWLAGVGLMVVAYGLESLALGLGDVTLVEPLIVTELVFALLLGARLGAGSIGRREWAGVGCVVAGVVAFLAAAGPQTRRLSSPPAVADWLLALLPCAGLVTCMLLAARAARPHVRAGLLAAGAGVAFGLVAVLTRVSVTILERQGLLGLLGGWEPYLIFLLGLGGFLLSQSAYQAAPLSSSLPVIDACEPVAAVVLAATLLGEPMSLGPGALALEVLGSATALVGVFVLGRSPVVLATYQADSPPGRAPNVLAESAASPWAAGVLPGASP